MRRKRTHPDDAFPMSPCPCPYCGSVNDLVSCCRDGNPPTPNNSITICIRCGGQSVITDRLMLRKFTDAEIMELMMNSPMDDLVEYHKMVAAVKQLHKEHPEAKRERT